MLDAHLQMDVHLRETQEAKVRKLVENAKETLKSPNMRQELKKRFGISGVDLSDWGTKDSTKDKEVQGKGTNGKFQSDEAVSEMRMPDGGVHVSTVSKAAIKNTIRTL